MSDLFIDYFVFYLLMLLPIFLAFFITGKLPIKQKIFTGFLIYGFIAGCASGYWWGISDNSFLSNLPGEELGYRLHGFSVSLIEEYTEPAYYETMPVVVLPNTTSGEPARKPTGEVLETPVYDIPWVVELPYIFVPSSVIFWGLAGLLFQLWQERR